MTRDEIADVLCLDPEAIYLDPPELFDSAIVGTAHSFGKPPVLCYDLDRLIDNMVASGMDRDEAVEYLDYNTLGAYLGEYTPIFLSRLK